MQVCISLQLCTFPVLFPWIYFFCMFLLSYSSLFVLILLIYLMPVCLLMREGEKRDCRFCVGREAERIWYEVNGVNQDQNILFEKIYFHFKIENMYVGLVFFIF